MAFLFALILVAVSALGYLAINSILLVGKVTEQTTADALQAQAEEFLLQLTKESAEKQDVFFQERRVDASNIAAYAAGIFDHPEALAREAYWKFDDHIFIGDKGQHLNGKDDISSVFIPNHVNVSDKAVRDEAELEAYLDFVFPKVLENSPDAVAIWMTSIHDVARYYPNIGLGNISPPDLKVSEEVFFAVANPKNDPERKVVWTPIYDDPAGQGLMITASAPVYTKNGFSGVLGVDVTLNSIIHNIEKYNPLAQSYAFLIDAEGYSIALPPEACLDILGGLENKESRISLNNLTNAFGPVIKAMREGSTALQRINLGEREVYVAYAPLKTTGFSLAIVVENAALLKAVRTLQEQLGASANEVIYKHILPFGLLITLAALATGFLFASRIVNPIKEMTVLANEISKGNLDKRIDAKSTDELGDLASAFNRMTDDLQKSRTKIDEHSRELEKKVAERTKELQLKNEELEKFNKLAVDRELKMVELKKKVKDLEERPKRG